MMITESTITLTDFLTAVSEIIIAVPREDR